MDFHGFQGSEVGIVWASRWAGWFFGLLVGWLAGLLAGCWLAAGWEER